MDDEAISNKKVQEAMTKFPVHPFDFERDERKAMSACSFAIVASSKSGKTVLLKYLLKKHFQDELKVFMTQSPQADIYNTIKKDCVFAPAYIPDIIKTCYNINKHTKNHYPFLVIIDDVMGAKNDVQLGKLMCLYRNSRISGIVVGQDMKMLNPTGRANVNNVLLGWQNSDGRCLDNIKDFLRTYFPKKLTEDEKIMLYKELTRDHCFLWVNQLDDTIKRIRLQPSQIVE
jgi:hypothetical protein